MKRTGFVSHADCARHDPGWNALDHQGRLPAIMRAVDAEMVALHEPVLHLEGRQATEEELRSFHAAEYLERVRRWSAEAEGRGGPFEVAAGTSVSGASWAASAAAAGTAVEAASAVLAGRIRNAFCAVRPPGRDAGSAAPGKVGFVNPLAVTVRWLVGRGVKRVLVVEWGGGEAVSGEVQAADVRVVRRGFEGARGADPGFGPSLAQLAAVATELDPEFVLLSAGFDSGGSVPPTAGAVVESTRSVLAVADEFAGGRLVSILEGGYEAGALGRAVVQHVRELAGVAG